MSDKPKKHLSPRLHPHRLDDGYYQLPWQPVFFTLGTAHERHFLTDDGIPEIIVHALDWNAEPRDTQVIAYCIMSNHLHVIACNGREDEDIRDYAKGIKLTTYRLFREAGIEPPYWQRGYWDEHAWAAADLKAYVDYVMNNPCDAGLCERPEDWPHSEYRGFNPPGVAWG